jgi:hypothetical protein
MSQVPPAPPYGNPPPGYGAPPPGYGAPPPPGYPVPGQSKSNGMAITSLIFGILGCIPWITGLIAVITGVLGIRKASREPQAGGKGMAITGLVLGLLSIVLWSVFGGAALAFFSGTKVQREVAREFVKAISAGDVAKAQTYCTPDITTAELTAMAAQAKGWGTLNDTTAVGAKMEVKPGEKMIMAAIVAQYSTTQKQFHCELIQVGEEWKIRKVNIQ